MKHELSFVRVAIYLTDLPGGFFRQLLNDKAHGCVYQCIDPLLLWGDLANVRTRSDKATAVLI